MDYELLYNLARGLHENELYWTPSSGLYAMPERENTDYWESVIRQIRGETHAQWCAWLPRLFGEGAER
jgi:hypothetical protein